MMSPKTSSEKSNELDAVECQNISYPQSEASTAFKPDALTLNLRWSVRDEIVSNISKFSSLILGAQIGQDEKKRIFVKNNELIWRLTMLSFEMNEKCYKDHIDLIDYNVFFKIGSECQKDLYFQIDWATRSRIIDQLIQNSSFSIHDDLELVTIKDNLLKENSKMIRQLLSLPFKQVEKCVDDSKVKGKPSDYLASKLKNKEDKDEEIELLKEEIKSLKKKIPEYWTRPLHSFDTNKFNDNPFKQATNSFSTGFNDPSFRHISSGFPKFNNGYLGGATQLFGSLASNSTKITNLGSKDLPTSGFGSSCFVSAPVTTLDTSNKQSSGSLFGSSTPEADDKHPCDFDFSNSEANKKHSKTYTSLYCTPIQFTTPVTSLDQLEKLDVPKST